MRAFDFLALGAGLFALAVSHSPVSASEQVGAESEKAGYWWYVDPPKETKADETIPPKPQMPSTAELAAMPVSKVRKLIEEHREYAITVLTVDAVKNFWKLEDFARRKSRAFAGVTQIVMLQNPSLNPRGSYPLVGEARDRMTANRDAIRTQYLRSVRNEFGVIMFARQGCGYCDVQWPIVQRFRDSFQMDVSVVDIDQRPDIASRFGVDVTPTTMVVRRGSSQSMIVANGVEAYPVLVQQAYQAIRLLRGDIEPAEFMTAPGNDGGYFDPTANGPIAPSVAQVIGGDPVGKVP